MFPNIEFQRVPSLTFRKVHSKYDKQQNFAGQKTSNLYQQRERGKKKNQLTFTASAGAVDA